MCARPVASVEVICAPIWGAQEAALTEGRLVDCSFPTMAQDLTESQAMAKIRSAFSIWPPTRGKALGKIDAWVTMLWKNQAFRDNVKIKNDGGLAHYACEQIETISKAKGTPWTRTPPAPVAKAKATPTASGTASDAADGWQTAKKRGAKARKVRHPWESLTMVPIVAAKC